MRSMISNANNEFFMYNLNKDKRFDSAKERVEFLKLGFPMKMIEYAYAYSHGFEFTKVNWCKD